MLAHPFGRQFLVAPSDGVDNRGTLSEHKARGARDLGIEVDDAIEIAEKTDI